MLFLHVIVPTAILVASLVQNTEGGQFESSVQEKIVDIHNEYRRDLKFSAANMLKMEWNDTLAISAELWANKCTFVHSDENSGENIWAISDPSPEFASSSYDPAQFLDDWGKEKVEDLKRISTPSSGDSVGAGIYDHYSQMIWSSTVAVGCAYASGCSGDSANIIVCHYSPPGNWAGTEWYTHGASCSECPSGYFCEDQLCVEGLKPTPSPTLAEAVTFLPFEEIASSPASESSPLQTPAPASTPVPALLFTSAPVSTLAPSPVLTSAPMATTGTLPTQEAPTPAEISTMRRPALRCRPATLPPTPCPGRRTHV